MADDDDFEAMLASTTGGGGAETGPSANVYDSSHRLISI